jgi:heme exporter protein A
VNLTKLNDKKLLRVQNLSCQRNNKTIFSNLTFELQAGSYLQVKGPNGSGKSSLLKTLAGLLPLSGGEILWSSEEFRDFIYLGHKTGIQAYLTAVEHLEYWLAMCARIEPGINAVDEPGINAVDHALAFWKIVELSQRLCQEFSAGQCQRLALARLKLKASKLWILDEPCNA